MGDKLSTRASNFLWEVGVLTDQGIDESVLASLTVRDARRVPNAGWKTLYEIQTWLAERGLAFAGPRIVRHSNGYSVVGDDAETTLVSVEVSPAVKAAIAALSDATGVPPYRIAARWLSAGAEREMATLQRIGAAIK